MPELFFHKRISGNNSEINTARKNRTDLNIKIEKQ